MIMRSKKNRKNSCIVITRRFSLFFEIVKEKNNVIKHM